MRIQVGEYRSEDCREVVCSSYVKGRSGFCRLNMAGWGGASPLRVSGTAAKASDIDSGPGYLWWYTPTVTSHLRGVTHHNQT